MATLSESLTLLQRENARLMAEVRYWKGLAQQAQANEQRLREASADSASLYMQAQKKVVSLHMEITQLNEELKRRDVWIDMIEDVIVEARGYNK